MKKYLTYSQRQYLKGHAHYLRHKEAILKRHEAYRLPTRRLLKKLKNKPCMDCHIKFPACIMQFDHRPGEIKIGNVSRFAAQGQRQKLLEEISKCDLVCANCHHWRTYIRRMEKKPWKK